MRASATFEGEPVSATSTTAPKLVVFITVDQLRGDMLDRYGAQLDRGYARLMRGAWFVNAFQDHAITETAPGHSVTMSGRFPRSTGIASNAEGVADSRYPLIAGRPGEAGASPERFRGTTLYDWLRAKDSTARALSVSMKDRAAILPIGRSKQDVYWYSVTGNFTTSTYYRDSLPAWVREFNARRIPHAYTGKAWNLLRDSSAYPEPDDVRWENGGRGTTFPHGLGEDTAQATSAIRSTPTMDSLTALFALEGLRRTGIGQGRATDVLAVSFSATDVIGHAFGPDSREAHDNELRLDRTIGWFIDSLYRLRDSSTVLITLTGDHGVQPIPEVARERGLATGNQGLRVTSGIRAAVAAFRQGLRAANADSMALIFEGELVGVDRAALTAAGLKPDSVVDAFAQAVKRVPGVLRVDRPANLRRTDPALDYVARRWNHQLPPNTAVELVITLEKYTLWVTYPATHGSPHDLDAHVPVIFYGPWARPGRYSTFARVVDMAPTIAAIAGVRPLEKLDGLVLTQAIR
jgi:hypothetical protein